MSNVNSKFSRSLTDEAECDRELEEQRKRMREQSKSEAKLMIKELKRLEKDEKEKSRQGYKRW